MAPNLDGAYIDFCNGLRSVATQYLTHWTCQQNWMVKEANEEPFPASIWIWTAMTPRVVMVS